MLNADERKLIVKICKLYYFESMTQEKIAVKFGISRPAVSKLLQKARDEAIVEILIHDDTLETSDLENEIETAFDLKQVLVVPTRDLNQDLVYSTVGKAAANFVLRTMKQVDRIGVSWGTTLYHIVKEFPFEKREGLKVVPLVGGMGNDNTEIHANQIAYELSKKLGGKCESLYAPAVVETEDLRNKLIELPHIAAVLEEGQQIDIALVGIGNPFACSTMEQIGYLNQEVLQELKSLNAVADINSRFINQEGHLCAHPIHNKVIGMELEQLRAVSLVIGIAMGIHKVDSILAALKGKYVHVLITDELTAAELVGRLKETR
ncbi:sugar-binding transcriptional regulator [Paenibacillus sp. ACRRX]|uniref:sugar-binding transcriptional regulator n=1 Tax=unclassified Paenibacillus TaxID=185978 RepID=UPI001EF746A1|nr:MULTISPECIES: sugar-binding transcriptional regulator [unclassified Paenibacillus]MCG7405991.1 sugar-binding transcriptional regulator [Paenibacillus sp. ACRRX]MDK8182444.1 sugar-binding transcriptional regulator [Paenibacillus sp. UMB4589-SE434]